MKKIIVALLLIALIFSVTNFVLANPAINLWFLPGQSNEVKGKIGQLINSAEKSIYIAVYDINDEIAEKIKKVLCQSEQ